MNKVKEMLEALEKDLREKRQYSAADKLLPIIEEAEKAKEEILKQLEEFYIRMDQEDVTKKDPVRVAVYKTGYRHGVTDGLEAAIKVVKNGGRDD